MIDLNGLTKVRDAAALDSIREITERFVKRLDPLKVYLFGSFADGSYTDESDYDFFIVVEDGQSIVDTAKNAYTSLRGMRRRPVDIVVGTRTRFEKHRNPLFVESEVYNKGILLYEQGTSLV